MPTANVRLATAKDIPAIEAIAAATWGPTYRPILPPGQVDYMYGRMYTPAALADQMAQGHQFLLLTAEEPVGFASVSVRNAHSYKLHKLYVRPNAQGHGHGRALLEATVAWVAQQGATALELNVNRYNAARDFYKRCGFRSVRQEDLPIGPYWMNDFVMRREW